MRTKVLPLVPFLGLAALASAQPPSPAQAKRQVQSLTLAAMPSPVPRQILIRITEIQDELKLTPAQRSKITELLTQERDQRQKLRTAILGPSNAGDVDAAEAGQKYVAAGKELEATVDNAIVGALDRNQRTRLFQLGLQADGPFAFQRPDVWNRLNLDDEQIPLVREAVQAGRREVAAAMMELRPDVGPNGEAVDPTTRREADIRKAVERRNATIVKIKQATIRAVLKTLSTGQQRQFRQMLGEPFDFGRLTYPSTR